MIAVTQTLSTWGGTFYVSKGLGFLYNNHLRSNRMTAGRLRQPVPLMRSTTAEPCRRWCSRRSDGEEVPKLAVGCAGNAWIPLSVYNIITGVIDGGLSARRRDRSAALPARPRSRRSARQRRAHRDRGSLPARAAAGPDRRAATSSRRSAARARSATATPRRSLVDMAARTVEGGAEPRRSHAAVAVEGGATLSQ